jgi:hypothetical protein
MADVKKPEVKEVPKAEAKPVENKPEPTEIAMIKNGVTRYAPVKDVAKWEEGGWMRK